MMSTDSTPCSRPVSPARCWATAPTNPTPAKTSSSAPKASTCTPPRRPTLNTHAPNSSAAGSTADAALWSAASACSIRSSRPSAPSTAPRAITWPAAGLRPSPTTAHATSMANSSSGSSQSRPCMPWPETGSRHLNGSVYGLTDSAGSVIERQRFSAFGSTELLTPNSEPRTPNWIVGNRLGFQGRSHFSELGLQYLRARNQGVLLGNSQLPEWRNPEHLLLHLPRHSSRGHASPSGRDPVGQRENAGGHDCHRGDGQLGHQEQNWHGGCGQGVLGGATASDRGALPDAVSADSHHKPTPCGRVGATWTTKLHDAVAGPSGAAGLGHIRPGRWRSFERGRSHARSTRVAGRRNC